METFRSVYTIFIKRKGWIKRMNRIRVFTSGLLFLFSIYCLINDPNLPFSLPPWIYIIATIYFAIFPIKDMIASCNSTLYKGRQFSKNYEHETNLDKIYFEKIKKEYNRRALHALLFWIIFLLIPGFLYLTGKIDRIWIFLFFALSNFSVFFAIFGWCPFNSIFIKPDCCMECRIYNWDSFFQYSFLVFIPCFYTIILFCLGMLSMIEWEYMHYKYPEHFYKISNRHISCKNCDLDACRKHKKKLFHKTLKSEWKDD